MPIDARLFVDHLIKTAPGYRPFLLRCLRPSPLNPAHSSLGPHSLYEHARICNCPFVFPAKPMYLRAVPIATAARLCLFAALGAPVAWSDAACRHAIVVDASRRKGMSRFYDEWLQVGCHIVTGHCGRRPTWLHSGGLQCNVVQRFNR